MEHDLTSRIISALLFGISVGYLGYHNHMTWSLRGKEAFLAHQSGRFEKYMSNPSLSMCAMFVIFTIGMIGLYELATLGVSRVLEAIDSGKQTN